MKNKLRVSVKYGEFKDEKLLDEKLSNKNKKYLFNNWNKYKNDFYLYECHYSFNNDDEYVYFEICSLNEKDELEIIKSIKTDIKIKNLLLNEYGIAFFIVDSNKQMY